MTKQLLLSFALVALAVGQMAARQLTPAEALARLMGEKSEAKVASKVRKAQAVGRLKLAYTSRHESVNTFYVYNDTENSGYVLLSADDCMPAVLGVVDKGEFVYENLPENMKWYLGVLDSSIKTKAAHKVIAKTISENEIAPLLGATEWDQMKPFNILVPEYEYGEKGKEQAPVGCVACATAQIMRFHKHPASGTGGEVTYKFLWDTKAGQDQQVATDSTEFSTNFDEHTYDWDNMIDKYNADSPNWTEEQGNAVSILLKDIGVAARMRYGTSASGGSGTQTYMAMRGMVNNFGYDPSMQFIRHKFYTDDEWDNIIYAELSNNRPVMFGGNGANGSGGHEYVCDGFKDGKFHINWGWSGSNNGWFLMTGPGLVPGGSGSGGAGEGASYGYDLEAAIGIKPAADGSISGSMATTGYTCKLKDKKLTLTGKFYNLCYVSREDTVGIQIQASDGTCYNFTDTKAPLDSNDPCNSIDVELNAVAEGEYTIIPIFKSASDENWTQMKVLSTFKAATLKYENESFDVTNNDAPKIEAEGAVTTNKKSFRPTKKKEDGTLDAEILEIICEGGIKNCDEKGQKLDFGCEYYDLTASNDTVDVYWLSNYAKTDAEELAPGASIKKISVEILLELEAGHSYEINPIFYVGVDDSLGDDAYWDALDNMAQYVNLGKNDPPVIDIEAEEGETAIATPVALISEESKVYDIKGHVVSAKNISELSTGVYIVKDARGVRKIVKK